MKNKTAIIFLAAVALAGCSKSSARSATSQSESRQAAEQRSNLLPDKAMMGQWVSDRMRYFIGPGKIVWRYDSTGVRKSFDYKIIEVNDKQRTVRLQDLSISLPAYHTFSFAGDNSSFEEMTEVNGTRIGQMTKFTYVDGKQEP